MGMLKRYDYVAENRCVFRRFTVKEELPIHFTEQWIIYYRSSQNIVGVMR